jgi:hypothetical protein
MATTGGSDLTFSQLEGYWIQAGGQSSLAPLMAAIALAESSGDPNAVNPEDNHGTQTSWGLWQISTGNHDEPSPDWADPLENAKLAVAKWKEQGLWAWGTYTSGKYKKYLPKGTVVPSLPVGAGNPSIGSGQGVAGLQPTGNPAGPWTSALGTVWNDVSSGLMTIPGTIIGTFGDIDKLTGKIFDGFLLFFQPSTYIRIGAGIFGFTFMITGLVFLAREARSA